MAQIFGSHSQRDEEYISFFSKAFLGTNVRGCFKEFENLVSGNLTAERVARDIEQSNAVFVIVVTENLVGLVNVELPASRC